MKRLIFFSLFVFASSSLLTAQNDQCFEFFPTKEGAVLVNKSYDAADNLICTTTYRVNKSTNYSSGPAIEVSYSLIDSKGTVLDNGILKASCNNGTFYMTLSNKAFAPDVIKLLGNETEMIGDFLDYPDTFGSHDPFYGNVQRTDTEFTIQSKKDKKKFIKVRVYDRKYVKNEPLNTPAGNFYASKVTFNIEARKDKETTKYKCTEWYAPNAGVIRSETYDTNGQLYRYNVLTSISGNE